MAILQRLQAIREELISPVSPVQSQSYHEFEFGHSLSLGSGSLSESLPSPSVIMPLQVPLQNLER